MASRNSATCYGGIGLAQAMAWQSGLVDAIDRHVELLKMEFRTFVTAIIRSLCQIVRTGRRRIFRLLNGNAMQPTFWRLKIHSRSAKVTLCRMGRLLLQSRRRRSPSN
jgi:hypothetical protein